VGTNPSGSAFGLLLAEVLGLPEPEVVVVRPDVPPEVPELGEPPVPDGDADPGELGVPGCVTGDEAWPDDPVTDEEPGR
jgi:hypothetical protein